MQVDAVDPAILPSARKHGVSDEDMVHAHYRPIRAFAVEDLVMLTSADAAGCLLEVGVATAQGIDFILQAMAARSRFLR